PPRSDSPHEPDSFLGYRENTPSLFSTTSGPPPLPACGCLRGQNFERCQTGRSAGAAGNEVRVCDQPEGSETDRIDDSTRPARASEQSDQIIRASVNCRVTS